MIDAGHIPWLRRASFAAWALALALAGVYGWLYRRLPAPEPPVAMLDPGPELRWSTLVNIPPESWDIVQKAAVSKPGSAGPLAQRFRLAGTFFAYGNSPADGSRNTRKAILDDLQKKRQFMVQEGERIDEIAVVHIFHDRITLRSGIHEEELWLSFADPGFKKKPKAATPTAKKFEDMPALEINRFGKRVGESRWVLSREALLDYHEQVLDDPERIAEIYLAFENVKDGEGNSAGYRLNFEGQDELFSSFGLESGDVIRRVNSMRMTSQLRGEYLTREFLKNRLNAYVFEVERNSVTQKLVHLIR